MKKFFNEDILKDIFEFLTDYFDTPERKGCLMVVKKNGLVVKAQRYNGISGLISVGHRIDGFDSDFMTKFQKYHLLAENKCDNAMLNVTGSARDIQKANMTRWDSIAGGFYISKLKLSVGCSGLHSPFADECMIMLSLREAGLLNEVKVLPDGVQKFLDSSVIIAAIKVTPLWKNLIII
jgi:hypothetical protein